MRIAIPKGRLMEAVVQRLERSGVTLTFASPRDYSPKISLPHCTARLFKPRAIPQLVAFGMYDLGFCGLDLIRDAQYENTQPMLDLGVGKVEIVVAVSEQTPNLLTKPPQRPLVIATEYTQIADEWAFRRGLAHITIQTHGSTEAYAPVDADIVIDCTETGDTMQANGLVIVEHLFTSTAFAFCGLKPTREVLDLLQQLS